MIEILVNEILQFSIENRDKLESLRNNNNKFFSNENIKVNIYYPFMKNIMLLFSNESKQNYININCRFQRLGTNGYKKNNLSSNDNNNHMSIIEFEFLYSEILIKLYRNKEVKFSNEIFGESLIYLLENRKILRSESLKMINENNNLEDYLITKIKSDNFWYLTKLIINFTYYELGSNSNISITNFKKISQYTKNTFDLLMKELPNNVISINVDEIKILNYNDVKEKISDILYRLELPYNIKHK